MPSPWNSQRRRLQTDGLPPLALFPRYLSDLDVAVMFQRPYSRSSGTPLDIMTLIPGTMNTDRTETVSLVLQTTVNNFLSYVCAQKFAGCQSMYDAWGTDALVGYRSAVSKLLPYISSCDAHHITICRLQMKSHMSRGDSVVCIVHQTGLQWRRFVGFWPGAPPSAACACLC